MAADSPLNASMVLKKLHPGSRPPRAAAVLFQTQKSRTSVEIGGLNDHHVVVGHDADVQRADLNALDSA